MRFAVLLFHGTFAFILCACATIPTVVPSDGPEECFDISVLAEIIAQVPSEYPNMTDGSIIMSWPYFVDLEIQRGLAGELKGETVTALSVQHTYFRTGLGMRGWWLRRNSEGGYNLLRVEDGGKLLQCTAGTPPASAYLTPGDGKTLDDLRKEGLQRYASRP